jgi:hypothetical protein
MPEKRRVYVGTILKCEVLTEAESLEAYETPGFGCSGKMITFDGMDSASNVARWVPVTASCRNRVAKHLTAISECSMRGI